MNSEEAFNVADTAVLEKTGKRLTDTEKIVFTGAWLGQEYPEIADNNDYQHDTIKGVGQALWKKLTAALGEEVRKKNFKTAIERRSLSITPSPQPTPEHLFQAAPEIEFPEGIEALCYEGILQPGCLLRLKAPLQMGKTLLMSRVVNYAKLQGYRTVCLNLRDATTEDFSKLDNFLQWFCTNIAVQLELTAPVDEHWRKSLGNSKIKCRTYFEKYLLPGESALTLALDEVDRLFPYGEIAGEFLGMLRTWHEDAKTRQLWGQFRLVVLHTEVYRELDINQSPFNAGIEIELTDLNQNQVLSLVQQYGLKWDAGKVKQLMDMVGGHPYLVKEALEQVKRQDMTLEQLLQSAPTISGIWFSCTYGYK
ncbi:MAG: AAA-like domain-containing protein [Cyanobacteriota bacterium]